LPLAWAWRSDLFPRDGRDTDPLLHHLDFAYDPGNRNRADGLDHADAGAARAVRAASGDCAVDVPDMAVCVGDGRDCLPDAVSNVGVSATICCRVSLACKRASEGRVSPRAAGR